MNSYKHDNLEIVIKEANDIMKLLWNGTCNSRDPASFLGTYLDALLEEVAVNKKVVFDFTGLNFMNSSTIAVILHFMEKLKGHPAQFEINFSKEKEWQDILFRTMRVVTSRMGNITVTKS